MSDEQCDCPECRIYRAVVEMSESGNGPDHIIPMLMDMCSQLLDVVTRVHELPPDAEVSQAFLDKLIGNRKVIH